MPARLRKKKSAHFVEVLCPSAEVLLLVLFNKWKQFLKKHTIYKMLHKTTLKLQVKTDNQQNPAFKSNFLERPWFCNVYHISIPSPGRG